VVWGFGDKESRTKIIILLFLMKNLEYTLKVIIPSEKDRIETIWLIMVGLNAYFLILAGF